MAIKQFAVIENAVNNRNFFLFFVPEPVSVRRGINVERGKRGK